MPRPILPRFAKGQRPSAARLNGVASGIAVGSRIASGPGLTGSDRPGVGRSVADSHASEGFWAVLTASSAYGLSPFTWTKGRPVHGGITEAPAGYRGGTDAYEAAGFAVPIPSVVWLVPTGVDHRFVFRRHGDCAGLIVAYAYPNDCCYDCAWIHAKITWTPRGKPTVTIFDGSMAPCVIRSVPTVGFVGFPPTGMQSGDAVTFHFTDAYGLDQTTVAIYDCTTGASATAAPTVFAAIPGPLTLTDPAGNAISLAKTADPDTPGNYYFAGSHGYDYPWTNPGTGLVETRHATLAYVFDRGCTLTIEYPSQEYYYSGGALEEPHPLAPDSSGNSGLYSTYPCPSKRIPGHFYQRSCFALGPISGSGDDVTATTCHPLVSAHTLKCSYIPDLGGCFFAPIVGSNSFTSGGGQIFSAPAQFIVTE